MEALEGFDPWIPKDTPDCPALLSSTFVDPVRNTTHWIPLFTTSCTTCKSTVSASAGISTYGWLSINRFLMYSMPGPAWQIAAGKGDSTTLPHHRQVP